MRNIQELSERIAKVESAATQREMTLDQVIDEFEREHSELLHLLAK